jgi:hypothetical protein
MPISILDFATELRHEDENMHRHMGITNALLWHHQMGEWWETDERNWLRPAVTLNRLGARAR